MKLQEKDGGVLLQVKVVPNASRSQIAGMLGDAAQDQSGTTAGGWKSESRLEELLAEVLGIP